MPDHITIDGRTDLFLQGQSTFAITALESCEVYYTVKREFTTIYKGKLSLLAEQPAFISLADLFADMVSPTTFELSVDDNPTMHNATYLTGTMYPGGQSPLSAASKLHYNAAKPSNFLLTTRTNNTEIFIPETEFTTDFLSTRYIDCSIPFSLRDADDHVLFLFSEEQTSPEMQQELSHFLLSYFLLYNKTLNRFFVINDTTHQVDAEIYLTEAPLLDPLLLVEFINAYGIKERVQLHSIEYQPTFEERQQYHRFSAEERRLKPHFERLERTDTFTASLGIVSGDRLAFVLDMLQSHQQWLITPLGRFEVTITPNDEPLQHSTPKPYPMSCTIALTQTEFAPLFFEQMQRLGVFTTEYYQTYQ